MTDMYMKLYVGEKPYSTIGEETNSVPEDTELLDFLGASNDIELGVLDDGELVASDYGELDASLIDSDDEMNEKELCSTIFITKIFGSNVGEKTDLLDASDVGKLADSCDGELVD
ncbi:hypothetical protein ACE6H2_021928 [Prunus campanulata]